MFCKYLSYGSYHLWRRGQVTRLRVEGHAQQLDNPQTLNKGYRQRCYALLHLLSQAGPISTHRKLHVHAPKALV